MNEFKGSQGAILELISYEDFFVQLKDIIGDNTIEFSDKEKYLPESIMSPKEAELKDFLKNTEWENLTDPIINWWLDIIKPNTRTPNWDFISTCTINGKKGLLLVEAKAHSKEIKENDRCGSKNESNQNKIETAINQAKDNINMNNSFSISISRDKCYQLSNRIAHAWWLASQGVPVILLYLGFLNCDEMKENGNIFKDDLEWQECFKNYSSKVGVNCLINESINCNKSEFKLICRSYPKI